MSAILTTAAELDALESFTPLRATIVGSGGTMTSEALAKCSPNGAWWVTGCSAPFTTERLLELANGGLTVLCASPSVAAVENVVNTFERIDEKLDDWTCWCPTSYRDNNVSDGHCPRHDYADTVRDLRDLLNVFERNVPPPLLPLPSRPS